MVQGGCLPLRHERIDPGAAEGGASPNTVNRVRTHGRLVAVIDRAVTVILEAVHTALRIFLHVGALRRIAVIVGVLLALAVTRAVVRRVVRVVDAVCAGGGLVMAGIASAGKVGALRKQTVSADFLQWRKTARTNSAGEEEDEHECDRDA